SVLMQPPAPNSWSIAECIGHLTLTAEAYEPVIRQAIDEGRHVHLSSVPCRSFRVTFLPDPTEPLEIFFKRRRIELFRRLALREVWDNRSFVSPGCTQLAKAASNLLGVHRGGRKTNPM